MSKTIMVVDDDTAIVDAITMILEMSDYQVAVSPESQVVSSVKEKRPDLLLLDIWMSGVDGRDVCRKLKSRDDTKNIPVVLISASRDLESSKRRARADDYLAKPFDMEDLLEKVEYYLQ